MTRSGHVYTLEKLQKEQEEELKKSYKGKAKLVEGLNEHIEKEETEKCKKEVSDEDAHEFLRFIKQSEYQIVD